MDRFTVKNGVLPPLVRQAAANGVSLKAVWSVFNEQRHAVGSISGASLPVTTASCRVDVW